MIYNTYNKFNTYGKLRSIMLGSYFLPEFFSKIQNKNVREPLMRIASEINEDLTYFEKVLKDLGIQVIRAPQPMGYFDEENAYIPPLQVRNSHAVIGNQMYQINEDWHNPLNPVLRDYCSNLISLSEDNNEFYSTSMKKAHISYNKELDLWHSRNKYYELKGSSWPNFEDYVRGNISNNSTIQKEILSFDQVLKYETKELGPLQGPNIINTPDTIFVDANEYCDYSNWIKPRISDDRPIKQFTSMAGHVDGVFAVLGNNTILGIDPMDIYNKYFPEYTVIKVPEDSYQNKISEYKIMKEKVNGVWWVAGEEHNEEFISYVESTLKSWVGYVEESIFDVNVLALDSNTICTSNVTPAVEAQLKFRGIDCIVIPWRHRFFVDGGLHCITLDLFRD